jgi:uncharacterized protein YqjF (DUF2071 family)
MRQTWNDLLFAHWPLPAEVLAPKIPPPLELDLFEGKAWLAVTPFHMTGIRGRGLPPIPGTSAFPELNVRTYVRFEDKPGVYFFSLDAANRPAVWGARAGFRLPYFFADMDVRLNGSRVRYHSRRHNGKAELKARYGPTSDVRGREKGTLEHFLTERYCLYTADRERLWRAEIHHVPWPLQDASAEFEINTMAAAAGIEASGDPMLLHFAKRLDVLVWPLRRVA